MGVRQFTKQTGTSPLEVGTPEGNPERFLTLLIDGAALNVRSHPSRRMDMH